MHGSPRFAFSRRAALLCAAASVLAAPGCTRRFFRECADNDTSAILTQKDQFPAWKIQNWHVYPHPQARFADPHCPDRPPYPPDDYAARVLSPNPQKPGKAGAGRFEGYGYMDLLAAWDAQNRGNETVAPGPDAPPATPAVPVPKPGELIPPPKPIDPKKPADPKAGEVGMGPFLPGTSVRSLMTMRPVPKDVPVPEGNPPADPRAIPAPPPLLARPRDATPSPTTAPKPPAVAAAKPNLPAGPGVIVAVGEVPDGNRTVPVVAVLPATQPPGTPGFPGQSPPAAPGKEAAVPPVGVVASGDEAAKFLDALTTNQAGFRIQLDQAVELGVVNSREFQDRREDLYLAALPVSLQRFSFAGQAFLTEQIIRESLGREVAGGPADRFRFNTTAGFQKLFPTGATLLVQFANQVVVDLGRGRPTASVSNLTLTGIQPLLRGGGYAVTMEPLTQAERNLLYGIRSYARFRKLFYVSVAAGPGGNITNNPYGLQGLSVNLGRGVGNNLTAPSVGYLPLLLQSAIIANQRKNIAALEQLLRLYEAFREGGQQSDLQVGQVEIQLLGGRTQLLGNINVGGAGGGGGSGGIRGLLDALDSFKLQLGLPMTTGLDLDDSPLRPIRQQLGRFENVYAQVRDLELAARQYNPNEPVNQFRVRWRRLLAEAPLVRGTRFSTDIVNRWAAWERLTGEQLNRRLTDLAEERRKILDRRADRQAKGLPEPDAETRRLNELEAELELGVFERAVRVYETQPWGKERNDTAKATVQAAAFRDVFNAFYQLILEGRNERLAQIRRQWPKLPGLPVEGCDLLELPLDDAYTVGMQAALTHRLDLMNARGQVVDAWRQVKVTANALQGVLDVRYDLFSNTPAAGANPLAFSTDRSTSRLTVNAQLPLVRRAERNNYRAALIAYQRQRRTLQAFEDNIANDVRSDIRELRTIAELYKIQQRLIELGYSQVDNAQAILLAPPAPNAASDAGSAAALTQQVLQAQSSLLQAQNTLYTIWVNYLISRMTLYLDLDTMQLDERGVWCDESFPRSDENPDQPRPEPGRPNGERLPAPRPVPGPGDADRR